MSALVSLLITLLIALGGFYFYFEVAHAPTVETPVEAVDTAPANTQTEEPTTSLLSVNLSNQNLNKMPSDILSMTRIQELNLSRNKLTGALPAEIRHLQNLEVLNISNNQMTGLPAELGQLSKLRVLNASNNQLTGIPHELGNLQKLEVLDLSRNNISKQDLEIIRSRLPSSTRIVL